MIVNEIAKNVRPNVVIVVSSAHAPVALSQPNDCDSTQMDEHDARPAIDYSIDFSLIDIVDPNTNFRKVIKL